MANLIKRPLSWHRECLQNQRANLAREEEQHERRATELERRRRDVAFSEAQIAEAEARGLTEFDSERFLKPRATKLNT